MRNKINLVASFMPLLVLVLLLTLTSVSAAVPQSDIYVASITATPGDIMSDHLTTEVAVNCVTGFRTNGNNRPSGNVYTSIYNDQQLVNTTVNSFQGSGTVVNQVILKLLPGNYNVSCKVRGSVKGDNPENNDAIYSFTVNPPPAVLMDLIVEPVTVTVESGKTQIFSAKGINQYGKPYSLASQNILWRVSSILGSLLLGTITPNGVFTAQSIGSGQVIATVGDISGSAEVIVIAPPPVINVGIDFVTVAGPSAPSPISPPGTQIVYARDPIGISTGIRNKGDQTISNVPVIVKLNGRIIMELSTGSIPPGGVYYLKQMSNYVFDMIGYNEISVEAVMPGDVDPSDNIVIIGVDVQERLLPDVVVSETCNAFNGDLSNIIIQCYVGNDGIAPANNFLFEVITSEGKIIHSETLSLGIGEWRLITRITNEPYPTTGELGIYFVANHNQAFPEITFGNNMHDMTLYPVPVRAL